MKIVVDANILFSALITPNGRLAKILSAHDLAIQRISVQFLNIELQRHHTKIVRYSKRSEERVLDDKRMFLNNIILYDEDFIGQDHWLEAERLTIDVDSFDISYVALALQTNGILWTGDKKLTEHLRSLGFDQVINTSELYQLLNLS